MPPMDMPLPNPSLMGVIAIGAGVMLWWLTPAMARRDEEVSRPVWRERFPIRKSPRGTPEHHLAAGYLGAAVMIALGVVILVVTAGRPL